MSCNFTSNEIFTSESYIYIEFLQGYFVAVILQRESMLSSYGRGLSSPKELCKLLEKEHLLEFCYFILSKDLTIPENEQHYYKIVQNI